MCLIFFLENQRKYSTYLKGKFVLEYRYDLNDLSFRKEKVMEK